MNLWNPDQDTAAQRANAGASFAWANKVFASFQKVVNLNLQTVKSGSSFPSIGHLPRSSLVFSIPVELARHRGTALRARCNRDM